MEPKQRMAGVLLSLGLLLVAAPLAGQVHNRPPVAGDDAVATPVDRAVLIDLLANDGDPDGDRLTFTVDSTPGLTDRGDGTVSYLAPDGTSGTVSFGYSVSDGRATRSATVTVTLLAAVGGDPPPPPPPPPPPDNQPPVASDDAHALDRGTTLTVAAPGVLANDGDPDGDPLSVDPVPVTAPASGALTLGSDGSFTYAHDGSTGGSDSFTYRVDDGRGGSDTAVVTLTIRSPGDPPVAEDDGPLTTTQDETLTIFDNELLANDSGDGLFIPRDGLSDPAHGTLGNLTSVGGFTYEPDPAYVGPDSFLYTVEDSAGQQDTATVFIEVVAGDAPPTASFTVTCSGRTCEFDGSGSTDDLDASTALVYSWDFGDGATGSGRTTSHTYAASGSFTATLTVTDGSGQSDSASRQVSLDLPPTASFTVTCSGRTCEFDGSGSTDDLDASTALAYSWDFGDGATGSGRTTSHTYAASGSFTATLTVTDGSGQPSAPASESFLIDLPPSAAFAVSCSARTCSFDASASADDLGIVGYVWSFGDGTSGTGVSIEHTYAASGTFTVTLSVTDGSGESATASEEVLIDLPPEAAFTFSCSNLTCDFDASASSDDLDPHSSLTFSWSFGDGAAGSGRLVRHSFARDGDYVVELTVTDGRGQAGSALAAVRVEDDELLLILLFHD